MEREREGMGREESKEENISHAPTCLSHNHILQVSGHLALHLFTSLTTSTTHDQHHLLLELALKHTATHQLTVNVTPTNIPFSACQ